MDKKAFTLLELLVVVLIIGILAAIALPQYKLAVGKAKFSELKNISKNVAGARQRYALAHDTDKTATLADLDVEIPNTVQCKEWNSDSRVRCCKNIFGKDMCFYTQQNTGLPLLCVAFSTDVNDIQNQICQKETGKQAVAYNCGDNFCQYAY